MLMEDQLNREADRRLLAVRRAFHWRICAERARRIAITMRTETNTLTMAGIAEDYEFLARYEERQQP